MNLYAKHYLRVVEERRKRGLKVNEDYVKKVEVATLVKGNPDIFQQDVNLIGGLSNRLKIVI